MSKGLTGIGYILGVINFFDIESQRRNGQMSNGQYVAEQTSNLYSTAGGIYGASWGIGWEIGRVISKKEYYRKKIRPRLQDLMGIQRDEYLKEQECIICEYIKKNP